MAKGPRGRRVAAIGSLPSRDRVRAGIAIKDAHRLEIEAAAATLPSEVALTDGRLLKFDRSIAGGVGYRCRDGMAVIASYDPSPHGLLLHISVSYADRDPRWKDLRLLRQAFFPADGPAKKTARQLRAEIRKASGGES